MAARLGSIRKIRALSVSGPGLLLDPQEFGVTEQALMRTVGNIVPEHDIVPRVGEMVGMIQNVDCGGNAFTCHKLSRTLLQVNEVCNNQGDITNSVRRRLSAHDMTCPFADPSTQE